jgi:hypothetical protein
MAEEDVQQGLTTADLAGATAHQYQEPNDEAATAAQARTEAADGTESRATGVPAAQTTPLLPSDATQEFRTRWESVQTGFVDEPRRAVEQADGLVAEAIQQLAKSFADERGKLEAQWSQGDDISTEDLRVALQRYRAFFERLLEV